MIKCLDVAGLAEVKSLEDAVKAAQEREIELLGVAVDDNGLVWGQELVGLSEQVRETGRDLGVIGLEGVDLCGMVYGDQREEFMEGIESLIKQVDQVNIVNGRPEWEPFVILYGGDCQGRMLGQEEMYNRLFEVLTRLANVADTHHVRLGIGVPGGGLGLSAMEWRDVMDQINSGYPLLCYDLRINGEDAWETAKEWVRVLNRRIGMYRCGTDINEKANTILDGLAYYQERVIKIL